MSGFSRENVTGYDGAQAFLIEGLGDLSGPLGFFGATPRMTLEAARELLGEPTSESWDNPVQRHVEYRQPIDHPQEGPRQHHLAKLVISSYNGAPIGDLQIALEYFRTVEWNSMIAALAEHLTSNLGKPAKRKKRGDVLELEWRRDAEKLWLLAKPGKLQIAIYG